MSAGYVLAGDRLHLERAAFQLRESGHAVVERQFDAMPSHVPLDKAAISGSMGPRT